jgi:hypothetical protein
MRVVVVGATRNVGTSLVRSLGEEPAVESVVGIARRPPAWQAPKTRWATADMTTDDLVPHFHGADAVVHLAWLFQPTHDPATTWCVNVVGSERVFQAVHQAEVPALVYASSVGAYSPGPRTGGSTRAGPPTAGRRRVHPREGLCRAAAGRQGRAGADPGAAGGAGRRVAAAPGARLAVPVRRGGPAAHHGHHPRPRGAGLVAEAQLAGRPACLPEGLREGAGMATPPLAGGVGERP